MRLEVESVAQIDSEEPGVKLPLISNIARSQFELSLATLPSVKRNSELNTALDFYKSRRRLLKCMQANALKRQAKLDRLSVYIDRFELNNKERGDNRFILLLCSGLLATIGGLGGAALGGVVGGSTGAMTPENKLAWLIPGAIVGSLLLLGARAFGPEFEKRLNWKTLLTTFLIDGVARLLPKDRRRVFLNEVAKAIKDGALYQGGERREKILERLEATEKKYRACLKLKIDYGLND